ncbi:putative beta-lactamase-like 1 [Stegostoma tigrinum]|uniref:putative beta-lactamase-like 1 n=1 Tax=Stegostoma tigrinum TaxID=3053191 RepID=UPI00202B2B00|nr:putative beta-lactamase-like 1 [Stegostoma tigrinum]XP_048417689.1 putative beta-lactamase-like 1 [Stegostoma tigrinum]XP_048417690.1 putative beta-lactamase-like 1 [Stegostoma tigrinum]
MDLKWPHLGMVFFIAVSITMTCCFVWQYKLPKKDMNEFPLSKEPKPVQMCPRHPKPVPLVHPMPILKEALNKVDFLLRHQIHARNLPSISAIVIFNDTVLWTGNFGKKNASDEFSPPPNEYTAYRIASISKIFPAIMLYKLWQEGKIASLDDPLTKYVRNFTVKNPLGNSKHLESKYEADGLVFLERGETAAKLSSVTLRRMASQLSGLPRRLRSTSLLWNGNTEMALNLLRDDLLIADPGTRCHYSNLAFSLLAHILANQVAGSEYQRWITENILTKLGMEHTGFEFTHSVRSKLAVGVYSNGQPAQLYDLGWYRPSGQMYSTTADLAKLAMVLLGAVHRNLLEPDTIKMMLTPVFRCSKDYFASRTGTPWEIDELFGYDIIKKEGDLDGYSATFSLIPKLKLGFVILMSGSRPQEKDLTMRVYDYLIPAMESAFRQSKRVLSPPPHPKPYVGHYTFANLTFYEIKKEKNGVLVMQQFGPHIESLIPERYRTIKLCYLEERVFQIVFEKEYPCVLKFSTASVSLEAQDGQLFNFFPFNRKGLSPGFDAPGLNTYNILRISQKPRF